LAAAAVLAAAVTCAIAAAPSDGGKASVPGIVDVLTTLGYSHTLAAGTGIVLSPRGEVLTNNHVIVGATAIEVVDAASGASYRASVVGYDPSADLAVLQLSGVSGLTPIPLGDSGDAHDGEAVTGYGNAGGAGGAPRAAVGRIVALGRTLTVFLDDGDTERLSGLIEVSAPLEPGDSGGPLVDGAGRTLGIDTAGSLAFEFAVAGHRGFAIPINRATAIAAQIESGRSTPAVHVGPTAFLGLAFEPSGQTASSVFGLSVARVVPSSAAARVGLRPGDVLTSFDGRPTPTPESLTELMLPDRPGDKLRLSWTDTSGGDHTATIIATSGPPQ
jgi:S1-C subfamily serine protease